MGNSYTPQVYSPSAPRPTKRSAVAVTAVPSSPELNLISPLMPRWEMLATKSRHEEGRGSSSRLSLKWGKCEEMVQFRGSR